MPILDAKGQPYTPPANKKVAPPKTGNAFGQWAGRDIEFLTLPGGGVIQIDLSKLTLADFRNMRDHYQVNSSLSVLAFMQHQSDWRIECEDERIAEFCEEQLHNNWTLLNRGMAQANWAGYSPMALEWQNQGNRVVLDKIKDLLPEECAVEWKIEEGWAPPGKTPPKFKTFNGIKQFGTGWPIPVENSLWYVMLMENGDYYGRKLLRPAFQSWFFSILLHLFANRYYERFGEPVPIGRAPFDDTVEVNGVVKRGNEYMLELLRDLRNRSVVVLPTDKTPAGDETSPDFDYQIEYLESQMRGADFERYMTRLDEEISLALFTPILLMRTADVGSYNLGKGHMQMYLWMLNTMNDDRKMFIDKYLLHKMADYNFGPNSARPEIKFRKLGNSDAEMMGNIITTLVNSGQAMPDLDELSVATGITLTKIEQPDAPAEPAEPPAPDTPPAPPADPEPSEGRRSVMRAMEATVKEIVNAVRPQVQKAFVEGKFGVIKMGFKHRMGVALYADGLVTNNFAACDMIYKMMDDWLDITTEFPPSEYGTPEIFMELFEQTLEKVCDDISSSF